MTVVTETRPTQTRVTETMRATVASRPRNKVAPGSRPDAGELGVIFMTGLFALLSTADAATRATILDRYVKTLIQGMETR